MRKLSKLALLFWFIYSPLSVMMWYELSSGTFLEFILTHFFGFGVFVSLILLGKVLEQKSVKTTEVETHEKQIVKPEVRTDVDISQLDDAGDDLLS